MPENPTRRVRFTLLFTALALGGMVLFYNRYDPWRESGPERIADGGFESAESDAVWNGWSDLARRVSDGGFQSTGGIVLNTTSNRHGTLRFTIGDLTGIHAFRVSLRATAADIIRGRDGYHIPRALFFFNDRQGKSMWHVSHGVVNLPEARPWRRYREVFPVPAEAQDARLHIQNYGAGGELRIDDVSVAAVVPRASAPWWRLFFGGLWLTVFTGWMFILRPWERRCGILMSLTALVILTGTVMPGELLDGGIYALRARLREHVAGLSVAAGEKSVPETVQAPPSPGTHHPEKTRLDDHRPTSDERGIAGRAHLTGHFALYGLLAFFASLAWLGATPVASRAGALLSGLLLFAAATEILQLITPDRKAGWQDLLTNLAGIFAAVLLIIGLKTAQSVFRRIRS
jgi:VanZ family protein